MPHLQPVPAEPYPWPITGPFSPGSAAVLVIDMQLDFCSQAGYIGQMGYDVAPLRGPIVPTQKVLRAARAAGLKVIYTRQGYLPDLSDLPEHKLMRFHRSGVMIGGPGPLGRIFVRGERGWQVIPELEPGPDDPVVDKTANGAFTGTGLQNLLQSLKIRHLAFCGNTIDVCVHSTLRQAGDLGYQCLLIEDCCGAVDANLHRAAVEMVKVEGGVHGSVCDSEGFVKALQA